MVLYAVVTKTHESMEMGKKQNIQKVHIINNYMNMIQYLY